MCADLPRRFERYVAIGDSSTAGIDDRDGRGGYFGWSRRLAQRIAREQGGLLYANFGVHGRRTREIRDEQLGPAADMKPDLATLFSGTNDVIAPRFDADAFAHDVQHMQRTLVAVGATVLTFTLPDLTPLMPLARLIAPRIRAMNEALRAVSARTGTLFVDFARHPVATDARLWSADRIHANSAGHVRIAEALAHALGLPGSDSSWQQPLAGKAWPTRRARLAAELAWAGGHLLPWVLQGVRPRSVRARPASVHPSLSPVDPAS